MNAGRLRVFDRQRIVSAHNKHRKDTSEGLYGFNVANMKKLVSNLVLFVIYNICF